MQARTRTTTASLTLLMRASATGQTEVVRSLLALGEDANVRGPRNSTALMFAAGAGHLEVVKELVNYGADTALEEDGGWCALRHAEEEENDEVISYLKDFS